MKTTVLIIDDSTYMRSVLENTLTENGYEVVGQAEDGEKGIDLALELHPDIITLDNVLPDMVGLEILKVLKEQEGFKSKIVMVSAVAQDSVVDEGLKLGADGYIVKPFTSDKFIDVLKKASME